MSIESFELSQLDEVAEKLIEKAGTSRVWCFYGEMGAGKTTLIKAICSRLGVAEGMSSPTFSIVNEYITDRNRPIYHFDFYRIESLAEAVDVGVEDYFHSGEYCFIEWPERVEGLLPEGHLQINIILVDEITRSIRLNQPGSGESWS